MCADSTSRQHWRQRASSKVPTGLKSGESLERVSDPSSDSVSVSISVSTSVGIPVSISCGPGMLRLTVSVEACGEIVFFGA